MIGRRRNRVLYDVMVDRKMLRRRRCLTLGLWRNQHGEDAVGIVVPLLPELCYLAVNTLLNLA